ncbi:hypothetical protein JOC86_001206 [Bacillus pakistanensis]|uniref:Uncharacterized protein n=1 Tax=Rossellomorea pakistanensis TaxID=992288 RepID=A0ABS2N9Y8_9BACI|nr:hypothetical protein [Bacillus pakistanensis]MBM7584669.1 hypothetical protein [Bacillus pakistanensis]
MKEKIKVLLPVISFLSIVIIASLMIYKPLAKESIIFFPIDDKAFYKSAKTNINLEDIKKKPYQIDWKISSTLSQVAYLRQDISFLFMNGILKAKMSKWEQNTDEIIEEKTVEGKESSLIEAISFHYSEIHETEDDITSSQKMSEDQLYVIDSNFHPLTTFQKPSNKNEEEWKSTLDRVTKQQLDYSWNKVIMENQIDLNQYIQMPLTALSSYNDSPLNGFTPEQWKFVVGNLWEGLYKNYFLGIKKQDGTVVESVGSTIPLLLFHKNKKELLVITTTKDGESVLLKQALPF